VTGYGLVQHPHFRKSQLDLLIDGDEKQATWREVQVGLGKAAITGFTFVLLNKENITSRCLPLLLRTACYSRG
jgi:hypothetical protein